MEKRKPGEGGQGSSAAGGIAPVTGKVNRCGSSTAKALQTAHGGIKDSRAGRMDDNDKVQKVGMDGGTSGTGIRQDGRKAGRQGRHGRMNKTNNTNNGNKKGDVSPNGHKMAPQSKHCGLSFADKIKRAKKETPKKKAVGAAAAALLPSRHICSHSAPFASRGSGSK